jgi:hypothetical protein
MKELGLTELRFESAEPDADTALDLFDDGTYVFVGKGIDGERLVGSGELSHEIAEAPVFTPADGAEVDPDDVVVEWEPIDGAETYQVIVESDDVEGGLDVILPAEKTSLAIPEGFLEQDTEYKIEVLAKLENGNQTLTENVITTTGDGDAMDRSGNLQPTPTHAAPRLGEVRPNPFNPSTSVQFSLPQGGETLVQIYDVDGQLVRTLVDGHRSAGVHQADWNGRNDRGTAVGSGTYFVRIRSDGGIESRKVIVAR